MDSNNADNGNHNTSRNTRSGNPRDFTRQGPQSRSSSSRGGASSHSRGDRGSRHRGGISRPDLYRRDSHRPGQPSRQSQVLPSQDVEALLSRSSPANGNDYRNMSNNGSAGSANTVYVVVAADAANLAALQAATAPQQPYPPRSMPPPPPRDNKPRRGHTDTRPSSATPTSRTPRSVASSMSTRISEPTGTTSLRVTRASLAPSQRSQNTSITGWRLYKKYGKCGNCATVGHSVMDCLVADQDGFIHACPICNMGNHTIDDCRFQDIVDLYDELVLNRGNKPPICTSTDWFQLWVSKGRPQVRLPLTVKFASLVASVDGWALTQLGFHDPKTYKFRYPCDPIRETPFLPADPATAASMQSAGAASLTLDPQITTDPHRAGMSISRALQGNPDAMDRPPNPQHDHSNMHGLEDTPRPTANAAQLTIRSGVQDDDSMFTSSTSSIPTTGSIPAPAQVNMSIVSSTPTTGSGRRRRRAVGPPPVPVPAEANPLINLGFGCCPNCGNENKCSGSLCSMNPVCRACGSKDHSIWACKPDVRNTICRCEPVPKHVRTECGTACRRCVVEAFTSAPGANPPQDVLDKVPRVIDCKRHCGVCDMNRDDPAHPADNVPYKGCQRPRCDNPRVHRRTEQTEMHFRQDCVGLLCPHNTCASNGKTLTRTGAGCNHCDQCGAEPNIVDVMHGHKCQWVSRWAPFNIGSNKIMGAHLVCKVDETHGGRTSHDLYSIRKAGAKRLWDDINAWIKKDKNGSGPRECSPVIECPDCFATTWPDGDYATQKPGKEPYSGTRGPASARGEKEKKKSKNP